jgi:hypothetical protein
VLDERGNAQCIGTWTDPPEPVDPPDEPVNGGAEADDEMTDDMNTDTGETINEMMNTDDDSDNSGDGMQQGAESVSGCDQAARHFPLSWSLLLVLLGLVRARRAQSLS